MSRILVTGGAGFIGSHLVRSLLVDGHDVLVVDSLDPQVHGTNEAAARAKAKALGADFAQLHAGEQTMLSLLPGVTHVVHLAAQVGVGQSMYEPEKYVQQNSVETAALMRMIRLAGSDVRKIVVASSMSVYGEGAYLCDCVNGAHYVFPTINNLRRFEMPCPRCREEMRPVAIEEHFPMAPTSVYGITKRDQEEIVLTMAEAYRISAHALRFFNVYGPGQAMSNPYTGAAAIFASRILTGQSPQVFEDGLQSRDFIHVRDIVRGIRMALDAEPFIPQVFNLGTGVRTTLADLAMTINESLGGPETAPRVTGEFREGDVRHGVADIRKARRLLGWAPTVDFQDGIRETLAWWVENRPGAAIKDEAETLRARGLLR